MIKQSLIFCISLLIIVGCAKNDNSNTTPSSIPGMGEAGGELQVSAPFVLPEGVTLISIEGIDDPIITTTFEESALKSSSRFGYRNNCRGSGGDWMALKMTFRKKNSNCKEIFLPAGCVFESDDEESQNGIVMQDIKLIFEELQETITAKIYLYCINKGRRGTSYRVNYNLKGITDCKIILDVITALQNKRIDISDFTDEDLDDYKEICSYLQDCVWKITNGNGLEDNDWNFIKRLRDRNR